MIIDGLDKVRSIGPMPALPAADAASIGTASVSRVHRARSLYRGPGPPLREEQGRKEETKWPGDFHALLETLAPAIGLQAAPLGQVQF